MWMGSCSKMQNNYTHSFHPYPAKFPANIVRKYIEKYSKQGESVIDPFCGSGTTLVESRLLGRNSLGIDINPVGTLISRVKSEKYGTKDMQTLESIIEELTKSLSDPEKWIKSHYSDSLPKYENRDYWFTDKMIVELSSIKYGVVDVYEKSNKKLYELLLTAFSKIIVAVSNQDTETRYARIEKDIKTGDALRLFLNTLKSYHKVLINGSIFPNDSKAEVIEGDTLKELPKIGSKSFDLAITSPPYINSFDYYLYHKHRIFLLNKNPMIIRKTEIGGHHTIDSQSFDKAFNEYHDAMKETFDNLHRILKPYKKFVLFIGDGVVKGKVIDMSNIMKKIAKETGFELIAKETVPLKQVSRRFIKDKKIERKKHHIMTFINSK